ncbi:MAG: hypothetical protein HY660_15275 [Armatimonadetes bacterium]|nr:hypothetical protein [Armatimonadota bacterium]
MPYLQAQDEAFVRQLLEKEMAGDVTLDFFTTSVSGLAMPGTEWEICEHARKILEEFAALSPQVRLQTHGIIAESDAARSRGIDKIPGLAIVGAEDYGVRFFGMPAGYEFSTLLEAVIAVSKGTSQLSEQTLAALATLPGDAHIQVFVTPT